MTKKQKKVLLRIILSAVLLAGVWIFTEFVEVPFYLEIILYLVPYGIIGYDILKKSAHGIRYGEIFDENFLMAVATIGAMVLGEYREGVAVMLFYQIGELFQSYAVGKSRQNIAALMDIRPDYANIQGENGLEQIDPDEVAIGDEIVVLPGEKVPIDGIIRKGTSILNTSALTGESIPREVEPGDEVISGCINLQGTLYVETTKEFGESTVSKILELVENSSMKKSRSENFITKFARVYTPAVCYSALALAILPPIYQLLIGHGEPAWSMWITRALTFLVISCPCALVISIPLSFFGGIGGASAKGILIKGSNYLETLAKVNAVMMDKTGTLTKGQFQVVKIISEEPNQEQEVLYLAAAAESFSKHPISLSLKQAWEERNMSSQNIPAAKVEQTKEIVGRGVMATVDGHEIAVGNSQFMEDMRVSFEQTEEIGTVIYVASDGVYKGYILIKDIAKPEAKDSLASMKALGVKELVMLTGDNQAIAKEMATDLGISRYYSQLLPADKVEKVEEYMAMVKDGGVVAFVGDGINDAPVLSRADVGIAMGALGSDAAIEAADIVLMDDGLNALPLSIKIARKTLRIVYQNIVFAIGVKMICLIFGALGGVNMWIAIFADVGVMIIAVLNAMRTLRIKA